jgi:hypothetical protein
MADADPDIDQLFQLPLDEFTPARNALAKRLGRPTVKDLAKPNVAAWAVNQLYWQHRSTYDALIRASERLRSEHRKLLAAKSSDIREAETIHRAAIRAAVDTVKGLLSASGQSASPPTMTAVAETLAALPTGEPPGRLTRPLKPLGFEALSGAAFSANRPTLHVVDKPAPISKRDAAKEKQRQKEEQEEERRAEKEAKEAKAELARTEVAVARARARVEKAEQQLDEMRALLDEAKSAHQRARLRARH